MLTFDFLSHLALSRYALPLLTVCLGCAMGTTVYAQAIRKIVDEKGVTYFTNQPPADDPLRRPVPVASVPIVSVPVLPVTIASAPAAPTSAPVKAAPPVNPAKALGDWPPRPLLAAPVPAK